MANKRYIKLSLNIDNAEDKQIYDILTSRSNMSRYIKKLILADVSGISNEQIFLKKVTDVITKTIDEKLSDKSMTDAEGDTFDPKRFLFGDRS